MLFSKINREYEGLKPYSQPDYDYLDRSARPEAECIRSVLEEWNTRYPQSALADLNGRFTSPDNFQHISAAYELYLHELFIRLGHEVIVHPETPTEKDTRPDFLIRDSNGEKVYVEAVLSTDESDEERAAKARLNIVFDTINRMEIYGWFLNVSFRSYPTTPPPGKKMQTQLKRWLDGLDYDHVSALALSAELNELPTHEYNEREWNIKFTAIPRAPEKRDKPVKAVIGSFFEGAQWSSSWESLRDSLISKGSHYGDLDAPMIIAVNAACFHIDEIDIMEALFGKETFIFDHDAPQKEPKFERAPNGFWHGPQGQQFTRVSGVLIGIDIKPSTFGVRSLTLYENPWAKKPIAGPLKELTRKVAKDGKIVTLPGLNPQNILQLPSQYPGLSTHWIKENGTKKEK